MDPERQWISRLEPETPADRDDQLDECPLGRVPKQSHSRSSQSAQPSRS